jgi:transcriptional regulator with XRE-family HTH domain
MTKKPLNPIDKHVGSRVRMRRMMLDMSQTKLGDALSITFQQVQKYEKGTNRIGASRLQHISHILQVPVPFFFEGAPYVPGQTKGNGAAAPTPAYVTAFLTSSDGLTLTKAFTRIKEPGLRRRIVNLVEEIAGEDGTWHMTPPRQRRTPSAAGKVFCFPFSSRSSTSRWRFRRPSHSPSIRRATRSHIGRTWQ